MLYVTRNMIANNNMIQGLEGNIFGYSKCIRVTTRNKGLNGKEVCYEKYEDDTMLFTQVS